MGIASRTLPWRLNMHKLNFYFDARYPGDNFVTVNEEDALECLRITEHIRETVKEEIEAFESLLKEDALEGFKRL